jgi:hypothetical protein
MRIKVQWQAQTYLGTNSSWNKLILEQTHLGTNSSWNKLTWNKPTLKQTHLVKET